MLRRGQRYFFLMVGVLVLFGLSSCGDDSGGGGGDAGVGGLCEGVDCSGHGSCAVVGSGQAAQAVCVCDRGYRADGLQCLEVVAGAECEGVDCSGHGTCVVAEGDPKFPVCICDEGYVLAGTTTCMVTSGGLSCGPGTHQEQDQCVPNDQSRPQGFCEASVLDPPGRVALEPSDSGALPRGSLVWTGDHYLVVYPSLHHQGLVAKTVTQDGQVGQLVSILDAGDVPDLWGGKIDVARCADLVCGYLTAYHYEDATGVSFVLDGSGALQASGQIPNGVPVGIVGGAQRAFVVLRTGFVSMETDGTMGALTAFGDGSRTVVAVARYSDVAPILAVDVQADGQWHQPRITGWDETGAQIFGPVDAMEGFSGPTVLPVALATTPQGFVLVAGSGPSTYIEGFDDQGRAQGIWYLNAGQWPGGLAVTDAFVLYGRGGPAFPVFQVADILGRPQVDAVGGPVEMLLEGVRPAGRVEIVNSDLAADPGGVGVLVGWEDGHRIGHFDFVRFACP